jgi:hypothetical protein
MSDDPTGYATMPRAMVRSRDLEPLSKMVWLVLSSHVGAQGCFPALETIADEANMNIATVKRHLVKLREKGYVTWIRSTRTSVNRYTLHDVPIIPLTVVIDSAQSTFGGDSAQSTVAQSAPAQRTEHRPDSAQSATKEHKLTTKVNEPKKDLESARARDPKPTRLPEDWMPSADMIEWARTERMSDEFQRTETLLFRNYWLALPGARAKKLDWDRTWQNWLIKSEQYNPGRAIAVTPNGHGKATEKALGWKNVQPPGAEPGQTRLEITQ